MLSEELEFIYSLRLPRPDYHLEKGKEQHTPSELDSASFDATVSVCSIFYSHWHCWGPRILIADAEFMVLLQELL